jgi:hypothetical protein
VSLATALYKWGACVCILCATPILADIQQTNADTTTSGTGQNSHQLKHRLLTTAAPNTSPVAKVSRQMPNTSPNMQSNPQSPNLTRPTRSDSHQLRSRTSSLSNDPNTSSNPQSPTSPLPTRTNGSQLRSRTSSLSNDPTTNDAPPTNTWFKYAWQKLTKAPRGSQMFHSPPLIRALRMSKSETTAHISQETWNKLHIAHMCWDDYVTDGTSFYRPLMNKVIQQAFTAEIRHIGLEGDNDKTKLKRISASKAIAIKKAWSCVEDDQLKGTVFEWEAPLDTHTLWTSPKKGTLVTCVQTGTFIGMSESRRGIKSGAETATSVPWPKFAVSTFLTSVPTAKNQLLRRI